ncbi:hypothetical protein [Streptacidiphilus sp. MAP12-33]|uniref:hypothetical protein n=1 Tax=Streptacidiphilus sp. MAP12-33 TaxID=3156266 RepID=UPI00351464A5
MLPADGDLEIVPQQRRPEVPLPRIAPPEVLFDCPLRDEHRDVLDSLAALGGPADQRC